ncbi:flippase [Thiohalobacter sp. IOR34]|uniref:flippase n=1 Tax=Thiohalobacter sp. IOR34 TaxID=3057176 RepID=UPI0025AFE831|nr:flippase [Thiohalobacter sp. IOR34]WJW76291.1 flippase [Thiohalobacter sp. IOR34]
MSERRNYLQNVAAQSISRILSLGANLVTFVLIARSLGAEAFGQFAFLMAYLNIACSAADLGTTAVLGKGLAQVGTENSSSYLGNFLLLRLCLVLCVTLVAYAGIFFVDESLESALIVIVISIPFVSSRFFEPIFQIYERPWNSVHASALYSLTLLLLAYILLVLLERPLVDYLYGFMLASIIYVFAAFYLVLRIVKPELKIRWTLIRSILALSAPVGVAGFFTIINRRADVIMLNEFHSSYHAGLYSAAYKLLDLGAVVAVTITTPLIPVLARKLVENRAAARSACVQMMEVLALVLLPLAIIAPYLADPVVLLLYGSDFMESAEIIGILAWVFVLIVYSLVGSAINLAVGDVNHGYWNAALAAVINVGLNVLVIPEYGFIGAAWTTLASHLSLLLVSQAYVYKNMGNLFAGRNMRMIVAMNIMLFLLASMLNGLGMVWGLMLALPLYVLAARRWGLVSKSVFS